MADGKINIPIVATYDDKDAKKALDDAEKIDGLEPEIEVVAKVDQVITAFDEVVTETKRVQEAAEALSRSLGPELAAKADTTRIVQELQYAGLTIEEIIADADRLGAKLKEVSDADVGGRMGASLGTARGKMDELTQSAGSSKSVMANMVGNTTQDLGQLAGVSGSAGVAIGQMGEYMADAKASGEGLGSVLKNFALVAGPIAGIAVATQLVSTYMKDIADTKAFDAEQVKTWKDALTQSDDVVDAMLKKARELDAIEFNADKWTVPGGAGFMHQVEDITELMYKARITGEEWYSAMVDGGTGWSDMLRRIDSDTRLTKDQQDKLIIAFTEGYDEMATATERAAQEQFVYGETVVESTRRGKEVMLEYIGLLQQRNAEGKAEADQFYANRDAAEQYRSKIAAVNVEAERVDRERLLGKEKRAADLLDLAYQHLFDTIDQEQATEALATSFDDLRAKAVEAWGAAITGATDAEAKARTYEDALLDMREQVALLNADAKVPIHQTMIIDTLLDQGKVTAAENAIAILTRNRNLNIRPILVDANGRPMRPIGGGQVVIEADDLAATSAAAPAMSASPMIVNVNMPRGSRGVDVVRQVSGHARRSGRRYGTPVVHYARR